MFLILTLSCYKPKQKDGELDLIKTYYDLSEFFDDDLELFISAVRDLTNTRYKRSNLREKLESLNLVTIESELKQLFNMTKDNLIAYKLRKTHYRKQTTIFDFMRDE